MKKCQCWLCQHLDKISLCARKFVTLSQKKNSRINLYLALVAVAIILTHLLVASSFYWGVGLSGPPDGSQDNKYQYSGAKSPEDESDVVNGNAVKGSGSQTESKNNNAKRQEYIRASRDLYAQEGMWRAANVLAVIGVFQFLFSIPALYMIWQTLRATRDTLGETQKATFTANRTADVAEALSEPI